MLNQCKSLLEQEMRALCYRYFSSETMRSYAERFMTEKLSEPHIFGALTVWHYRMFGGDNDHIYQAAAGIELLILSSDILDDLQDQDALTKPWMQIPSAEALNVAIGLLMLGQQALLQGSFEPELRLQAFELVQEKLLSSLNGQMIDIQNQVQDTDHYLEMTRKKSASLFVMACGLGAMLALGTRHYEVEAYAEFMGLSAQLNNDCRDLFNWTDKSDFRLRKRTFPILYLMESVEGPDMWVKTYMEEGIVPNDTDIQLAAFKELCERYGAILFTQVQMRMYYYEFIGRFDAIPETGEWKDEFLREFAVSSEPL